MSSWLSFTFCAFSMSHVAHRGSFANHFWLPTERERAREWREWQKSERMSRMSYDKDTNFDGEVGVVSAEWMIMKIGKLKWCQHEKLAISKKFSFQFHRSSSLILCVYECFDDTHVRQNIWWSEHVSLSTRTKLLLSAADGGEREGKKREIKSGKIILGERTKSKNQKLVPSCIIN